jgi:hypothetical protein
MPHLGIPKFSKRAICNSVCQLADDSVSWVIKLIAHLATGDWIVLEQRTGFDLRLIHPILPERRKS